MNAKLKVLAALTALQLLVPTVFAQSSIYQITGRVVAVDSTRIVLQSNHQQWVILRNDETRIVGPMRLGSVVTIDYKMLARIVQVNTVPGAVPIPPRMR